jgi:ubiquinone/menaquinone biosynthesis C-methylase UbiE
MAQITLIPRIEEGVYSAPTEWRLLGAKDKAEHIIMLCRRNGLSPRNLLEVGAGDGAILRCLSEARFCAAMSAVEVSPSGVSVINCQGIPGLVSCELFDGYHLPFEDAQFDLLVLSHVLEHVEFERALLREIQRVSRHQVIEIPLDFPALSNEDFQFLGPSYGHINAYTPASLRFLLATEGIIVKDELLGQYSATLQEYDYFINGRRQKTPEAVQQFQATISAERDRYGKLSRPDREQCSSFYAVLTLREEAQDRSARALKAVDNYIDAGQLQAARLVFAHAIPQENAYQAALQVAQHAHDRGHWQAAREFSDRILEKDPRNPVASMIRRAAEAAETSAPSAVRAPTNRLRGPTRLATLVRSLARRIPFAKRLVGRLRGLRHRA